MTDAPMIWGLDPSKRRCGITHGRAGDRPVIESIESKKDDDVARASVRLYVFMHQLAQRRGLPAAIFYERILEHGFDATIDPITKKIKQRRGIIAAFDMARIAHTIVLFAGLKSIRVVDIAPSTARKTFFGHGKLGREEAKLRASSMCEVLGWSVANDDEADSAPIWHQGCTLLAPRLATPIHSGLFAKAAIIAERRNPAAFANIDDRVPW